MVLKVKVAGIKDVWGRVVERKRLRSMQQLERRKAREGGKTRSSLEVSTN